LEAKGQIGFDSAFCSGNWFNAEAATSLAGIETPYDFRHPGPSRRVAARAQNGKAQLAGA